MYYSPYMRFQHGHSTLLCDVPKLQARRFLFDLPASHPRRDGMVLEVLRCEARALFTASADHTVRLWDAAPPRKGGEGRAVRRRWGGAGAMLGLLFLSSAREKLGKEDKEGGFATQESLILLIIEY